MQKYKPYLLFAVCSAAFTGFLYGYFTAVISGALIFLITSFHLTPFQEGMVVSMLLLGALLGALIAGVFADRFGRKWALFFTSVLFILGALTTAFCHSYTTLLIGRFIGGIGAGIVSVVGPLYIAEISPTQRRGSFVSLFQLMIAVGIMVSFLVDYLFSFHGSWRWMFGLGIIPALIQMGTLFFAPETPPWQIYKDRVREAAHTMHRFYPTQFMPAAHPAQNKTSGWKKLLAPNLRFILIVGFLLSAFQQITGVNAVYYYAPKIFATVGFKTAHDAILATTCIGIINVIATIFSVWLLSHVGRRVLLIIGTAGMGVSLGLMAIAFLFKAGAIDLIAVVSLMAYAIFFAIGLGPVTYVLLSEIYPMHVRAKAITIAIFINWACNYMVSLTFPDLIRYASAEGAFLLYAGISIVASIFTWRYIPETRGKSLEEIEKSVLSRK